MTILRKSSRPPSVPRTSPGNCWPLPASRPLPPRVLDLNETVEGMLKMLRRLIGEDIDLAWLPGAGLRPVRMDPSQIDQILANLCVNARDAIADVGKITIETDMVTFDEAYCADHAGFVPGEFVLLAVSDDGCGMDKETLEHIFSSPFSPPRGWARAPASGLPRCTASSSRTTGSSTSTANRARARPSGSTCNPRGRCRRRTEESAPGETPEGQGETILVVEDELAILKLVRIMLERLGYTVLTAGTPDEAMRLAEAHAGEIHLLLTDVVMPEMNGRELAERLMVLKPDLKLLFMSGYTADVIAHRGVLDEKMSLHQEAVFQEGPRRQSA